MDDQQLSSQDIQDLQSIHDALPANDSRKMKVKMLLAASGGIKQQNYSAMRPQDLAAQAMQVSGVTGTQRLAPTAPRVDMQQQPTMAGAAANNIASAAHEAFSPSGSVGRFHQAFENDLQGAVKGAGDMLVNGGATPQGMAQYMIKNIAQSPHPLASAAGVNGEGIEKAAQNQDYASILGHSALPLVTAMMAGRKLGEATPELNPFPSRARAGETFAEVKNAAGEVPIDVNAPGEVALRTQELANSGGSMPKVIRDFLRRTTSPGAEPLTYSEARDFYSNATRLSADEFNRLTPVMKKQVGEFTGSLNESITQAADQAGKKAEYLDAMGEYAAASRWRKRAEALGSVVKKIAVASSVAAGAGYTAKAVWDGNK